MRLSSKIVSLLCVASILAPFAVDAAAVTVKVKDLIAIMQANKKPLAFNMDVRGSWDTVTATLAIKGTQNGDMKSLAKAATDVTFVLDAKMDATTSGHAELHGILVNQTAYLRLEKFTVKGEWAAYNDMVKPYLNTWFSIPVDPEEYAAYIKAQEKSRRTSFKELDAFFKIATEQLRDGKTRYTVTIPKNKQRRLLSKIFPNSSSYMRNTTIDFNLTIDALKNVFDMATGTIGYSSKANGTASKFSLSAKTSTLKTTPRIAAPSNSTPWETFLEEQAVKSSL